MRQRMIPAARLLLTRVDAAVPAAGEQALRRAIHIPAGTALGNAIPNVKMGSEKHA